MQKFNLTIFRILLVAAGASAITYSLCTRQLWLAIGGGVLCLLSLFLFWKARHTLRENCWLMLEAMRNSDYSFRLPMHGMSGNEFILQNTLNNFGKMMGEQKRMMEQKEKYYELILESVTTGIIVLDEKGCIIQTNSAAARLLCLPALSTLSQINRYGNDNDKKIWALGHGESMSLHFLTEKGEAHLLLRVAEITLAEELVKVIVVNDIRDEMSDKELNSWIKLTRVLTHEIMNSIAPISSLTETFMNRKEIKDGPLYDGMRAIHETSNGLMSFVDSYRKFSALQKPQPVAFSLPDMLKSIRELGIIAADIRFTQQIDPEDLLIYADPNLIRQVFINLIKNAVQAIQETDMENGLIHIQAFIDESEHTFVYISNNGPKVEEQTADEIFVPFFTTKKDGNGIGLSLSRRIMTLSGGRISLLPPGTKGWNTTFLLEFE